MKNFTLLLLIFTLTLSSFGYHNYSNLVVSSDLNRSFQIWLDGRFYGNAVGKITLKNIQPGYHYVELKTYNSGRRNCGPATNVKNRIWFPQHTNVTMYINPFGQSFISQEAKCTTSVTGCGNFGNYYNTVSNSGFNNGCRGMSETQFTNLVKVLRNQNFDSNKRQIAKNTIARNGISTNQLVAVLNLFSFESSKLEIAKYAYNYTIDPDNYFVVYDVFTFSSSVNNLSAHIYR